MLSHTVKYFAIRAANGVLALASLYVLTRLLTREEYGVYVLGIAAMNVMASVLFQWLNAGVGRLYAAHLSAPASLMQQVRKLFAGAATAGLALLALWLLAAPVETFDTPTSIAIGLGCLAVGAYNLHLQMLNARQQPLRYGALSLTRAASALAAASALVLLGGGAVGAVAGVAFGAVMAVLLFGLRWPRSAPPMAESSVVRRQIITYGAPLALIYGATMVIDVSDRFLIAWFYGASTVSGYAASYDLAQQTVGVVLNVFFLASFPRVTAAWETGGRAAAREALEPLSRALLLAAPAAAGVFLGMAPELARLMFGQALHADAVRVMPWVAAAIAVGGIKSYLLDVALQLERRTGVLVRITVLMAAANVLLNLALLPTLGVVGAAIAVTTSFALGAVLSYMAGRDAGVFPPLRGDLLKALLSMVAMVAVLRGTGALATDLEGALWVGLRALFGLATFAAAAVALDLCALRTYLCTLLRSSQRPTR